MGTSISLAPDAGEMFTQGELVQGVRWLRFDASEQMLDLLLSLDLKRIQIEAQQKIEQARAEAESLRIQREEITTDLLRLREIEVQAAAVAKWDGRLPSVTGGTVPFINVK